MDVFLIKVLFAVFSFNGWQLFLDVTDTACITGVRTHELGNLSA